MIATVALLGAALLATTASAQTDETCVAAWSDERGEPQTARIVLTLSGAEILNRAAFPERTTGIVCLRASIVPLPDDVRVLGEAGVSFGIVDEGGRSLWIWARAGRLQTTIENGRLSRSEAAAVRRWSVAAQRRFTAALSRC